MHFIINLVYKITRVLNIVVYFAAQLRRALKKFEKVFPMSTSSSVVCLLFSSESFV